MRDPRRLGAQRVRVQIALGDLTDPPSFRNALRGVHTVVHLAASIRDQPGDRSRSWAGSQRGAWSRRPSARGVERFVFFSALGASTHHRSRCLRAKALAEQAVGESDLRSLVFAPSIIYAPGDPWLTLLERLALLPAMPVSGRGRAALPADLGGRRRRLRVRGARPTGGRRRASATSWPGPRRSATTRSCACVLRSLDRRRPLLHVPTPIVSRALRASSASPGPRAFATWDEAELMEISMTSARGAADAEALGVTPQRMATVLGRA